MQSGQGPLAPLVRRLPPAAITGWALTAAFATYFCMYAYRKPFTVAEFDAPTAVLGAALSTKILFVMAQTLGYASSKFLGIKVISELSASKRALAILGLIGVAEAALLLFGLLPAPWSALALFANGVPLGMIWGLVFGFLEGRRTSDLLGAGLCASFIVASGFVKSVGQGLINAGVSEGWMPFFVGLIFALPLTLFVAMLAAVPPPDEADVAERTERQPMDAAQRKAFWLRFWPGLSALVGGYLLLTIFRTLRDDFARELWGALGFGESAAIYTLSELPVAFGSLAAVAVMVAVRDNRAALVAMHGIMVAGAVLVGAATLLWQAGVLPSEWWMVAVGLGAYLGYVPINCVLFDRLIAASGTAATAGFLIYVADAGGYAGVVGVMLWKNFASPDVSWLGFFTQLSWLVAFGCAGAFAYSGWDLHRRTA